MAKPKQVLEEYYSELLDSARNPEIALGLSRAVSAARLGRAKVMERFPDTPKLAEAAKRIKEAAIGRLDELVALASQRLEENGAKVYRADSAKDALEIVDRIVGTGKMLVSGKTLTGEEVDLRHHLEAKGNEYWETDAGQLIQQIRDEKPMHYIAPALHVPREEVAKLLTGLLGREVPPDIVTEMREIRNFLRNKYFKADFGISGCNVMAADTGSLILLENEGNIRMSTNVPPVHIAICGIEKVVPTLDDAYRMAEVIWRYGGFTAPLYVSIIGGPSASADIEYTLVRGLSGPLEVHVIFLDNGRSKLAKDPVLREALYCVKCGSCLFECPIFEMTAGHFGGTAYFGGVGSVLSAYIADGFPLASAIAYTCLRCGRCVEVCPFSLDTSRLITEMRHCISGMAKGKGKPAAKS